MSDFIEQFKADKGVRDLVKRKVLTSQDLSASWRYDSHDLNFRITHIKRDGKWSTSMIVNVAVSGGLKGWGWRSDEMVYVILIILVTFVVPSQEIVRLTFC